MDPGCPLIVVLILACDKLSSVSPACTAGSANALTLLKPSNNPEAKTVAEIKLCEDIMTP